MVLAVLCSYDQKLGLLPDRRDSIKASLLCA